ncbi:MAG: hypothetical protein M1812_003317 [Candelaria pacifica]|nr:MAG: hypothetical protein M1812_003317 [Candelaria pacifica]
MTLPRILVIAGSDSSGGAGLEADQKVIAAHGCYAMTATTALTAQDTLGVYDIHHVPPDFVRKQIDACVDDIGVDAVKVGMLASESTVNTVADALRKHHIACAVIDPVMVSTSGSRLLPREAVRSLRENLLPLTKILTPNIPEAMLLLEDAGIPVEEPQSRDDLVSIAKAVQALGAEFVLVKGGHLRLRRDHTLPRQGAEDSIVADVLHGHGQTMVIETPYLHSKNTHGTGCCLACELLDNV